MRIGLDDLLDGIARLGQRGGDGVDADRTAAEIDGDALQVAVVHGVEAALVDLELAQRLVGERAVDHRRAGDGGEVAHAAQQAAGDARRAARAAGDLAGAVRR